MIPFLRDYLVLLRAFGRVLTGPSCWVSLSPLAPASETPHGQNADLGESPTSPKSVDCRLSFLFLKLRSGTVLMEVEIFFHVIPGLLWLGLLHTSLSRWLHRCLGGLHTESGILIKSLANLIISTSLFDEWAPHFLLESGRLDMKTRISFSSY